MVSFLKRFGYTSARQPSWKKIMRLFLRKPCHSQLGIDINPNYVHVLEMSTKNGLRRVEGLSSVPLSPRALWRHTINDVEEVAEGIQAAISQASLKSKLASVAMPDQAVNTKILEVSAELTDDEIEEFITLEADKYIPYPAEELCFDFVRMGRSLKNASMITVLVVAATKVEVNARLQAVTKAGLKPICVDVEAFVKERVCPWFLKQLLPSEQVALCEIGDFTLKLYLFCDRKIIARGEEALAGDVLQCLQSMLKDTPIKQLLLAGKSDCSLAARMQQAINLPVTIADLSPFLTFSNAEVAARFAALAPYLLVAAGLVLGGLHD